MSSTPSISLSATARILVIRLRRLGDLILLTPTLRALRQAYPQAHIDVLVLDGFHIALAGNPHINRLLRLKRGVAAWSSMLWACRRGAYDTVLDFQSSSRSLPFVVATRAARRLGWRKRGVRDWAYTHHAPGWDEPLYVARNFTRFAAPLGVAANAGLRLEVAITDSDRATTAALLAQAGIDPQRPIIALSVVSKEDRKRWAPERYAELANRLVATQRAQLVFSNGPGEVDQVRAVVERLQQPPALWNYGATTLGGLAALYERCNLWIGNDGGPKHVATAAGCPTLVIIKAGDERFWTDTRDPHQAAVCDPEPHRHDPNSVEGVLPDQVLAAVVAMRERGGWLKR